MANQNGCTSCRHWKIDDDLEYVDGGIGFCCLWHAPRSGADTCKSWTSTDTHRIEIAAPDKAQVDKQ
jgi:hypothetical protein